MRHEQKRILCTAVAAMVTSKDGAKFPQNDKSKALQQQPWLRAIVERCSNSAMCSNRGYSKDGAKPQKEYSPG